MMADESGGSGDRHGSAAEGMGAGMHVGLHAYRVATTTRGRRARSFTAGPVVNPFSAKTARTVSSWVAPISTMTAPSGFRTAAAPAAIRR